MNRRDHAQFHIAKLKSELKTVEQKILNGDYGKKRLMRRRGELRDAILVWSQESLMASIAALRNKKKAAP